MEINIFCTAVPNIEYDTLSRLPEYFAYSNSSFLFEGLPDAMILSMQQNHIRCDASEVRYLAVELISKRVQMFHAVPLKSTELKMLDFGSNIPNCLQVGRSFKSCLHHQIAQTVKKH